MSTCVGPVSTFQENQQVSCIWVLSCDFNQEHRPWNQWTILPVHCGWPSPQELSFHPQEATVAGFFGELSSSLPRERESLHKVPVRQSCFEVFLLIRSFSKRESIIWTQLLWSGRTGSWLQSYRLTGWVWETTAWSWRLQENYRSFRAIYRIYPNSMKENRSMSTFNQLDLQTLGSRPVMLKNLPDHCMFYRICMLVTFSYEFANNCIF